MLVSLERSGGFTGRRVTSSVDTDDPSVAQMSDALRALDELAAAPPATPGGGASQPHHRLTIHRASGQQVVDVVESQIPAALRPLLSELMRRARAESE
jgi:hypothetical protein